MFADALTDDMHNCFCPFLIAFQHYSHPPGYQISICLHNLPSLNHRI